METIILGAGISGLMAAVMLARSGTSVLMLSYHEAIRSASCMAQGGINAADELEGDSVMSHFTETVSSGGYLADQQPVMDMCRFAPDIVSMYDRIGVAFNRRDDGSPDTRSFGGSKFKRTHYADTTTGTQLLSALDGQARRYEEQGLIKRISGVDFVSLMIDESGCCRGVVVQEIFSMKFMVFWGSAVIIASGSYSSLYGRSTTAKLSNGAVAGQLLMQGIPVANPEFVQFHPTAMAQGDKPRLVSESARGEGGRLWAPRGGKPWYFLEEMYPEIGNLVSRDLASRAIYKVIDELGLGVGGKRQVYLDITQLPKEVMEQKLSNIIDLYEKFSGEDPGKVPMRVYPAPHYSMGGIYVDHKHRTELLGLYACGECDFMYHGANRLGGNSLLSATFGGYTAANTVLEDFNGGSLSDRACSSDSLWIDKTIADRENEQQRFLNRSGKENAEELYCELGELLTESAGIIRKNVVLKAALVKIQELKMRAEIAVCPDRGTWANSSLISLRKLQPSILLAEAILEAALNRDESRGAHYKPEFPERDDRNFLKTTVARAQNGKIELGYALVDTSILPPQGGSTKEGKKPCLQSI